MEVGGRSLPACKKVANCATTGQNSSVSPSGRVAVPTPGSRGSLHCDVHYSSITCFWSISAIALISKKGLHLHLYIY